MSSQNKPASSARRPAETGHDAPTTSVALMTLSAWLVPGAGHLLQGRFQKALVFFVALVALFALGIGLGGRLFPFQFADPLVFLAGVAEWGMGACRFVAMLGGLGDGRVTAATYEYGNTFLIVAGLLNALVILDAMDLATGRKPR
jgi:Family of unknown function (DUF6677)